MFGWRRRPVPLGRRGEDIARRFLRRRGMRVLARNYRCPAGEADLIVLDPATRAELGAETLAFVEVKTRASDAHVAPASAVDTAKRRHLRRIAAHYLAARPAARRYALRFDIVSIVAPPDGEPRIDYLPGAFQ